MTGETFPDRFKRWYAVLPPALRILMTVNTVLYVLWVIVVLLGLGFVQRFTVEFLALRALLPEALMRPWQLVTYGFLHLREGLWGFIAYGFNMLWLYWIGRDYEEVYGSHRLFGLYILATFAGGVLVVAGALVFPAMSIPVAGALAAVLGVLCGVATLNPNRGMGLFLLGVVPIKWIAIGFLVLAVLFFAGAWPYVLAYLGAAGAGFGFAKAQLAGYDLAAWAHPLFRRSAGPYGYAARPAAGGGGLRRMQSWMKPKRGGPEPANVRALRHAKADAETPSGDEVIDRLLDKISEKGYESLTDDEKRLLYEASQND